MPIPSLQYRPAARRALFEQLGSEDLGGPVSYPIVANIMVFVTVSDTQNYGSQIFAPKASNGKIVWQKAIGGTYFESYLTYENGIIYDLNYDGLLQAYNATTGAFVMPGLGAGPGILVVPSVSLLTAYGP